MFNLKSGAAILVVSLSVMPSAFAESVAEEIARINEEIAVLSAKKTKLEMETQVETKKVELVRLRSVGTSNVNASNPSSGDQGIPVVRSIEGVDGRLSATLAFGGGILQNVKQGEKIRGGWTVTQINVNEVWLARGNEKVLLGFGSEPQISVGSPVGQTPMYPSSGSPGR